MKSLISRFKLIDHPFSDLLHELATMGQVPLPVAPHSASEAFNTNKRVREEDNAAQYPRAPAPPAHYPPEADLYHPPLSAFARALHPSPTGNQFGSLPTYTADLGKLPVFHQRTPPPGESTSSWYPTQAASPLGRPHFAVGIVPPDADNTSNSFPVDPLLASEPDYAPGGSNLSNDVMAMWATAPTGFECVKSFRSTFNLTD
jgi:hypothetical protein